MDSEDRYRLIITVASIRGRCPVFKVGDRITIESPKIILNQTDNICIHALGGILSMIVPLSRGINFKELGKGRRKWIFPVSRSGRALYSRRNRAFPNEKGKNLNPKFTTEDNYDILCDLGDC